MSIGAVDETRLSGTGVSRQHVPELLDKLQASITALDAAEAVLARLSIDGNGNLKIAMDSDGNTYTTFNSTLNRFEFYINGSMEGILDATGWSTEPAP